MPTVTPSTRKSLYAALAAVNVLLIALATQNVLPANYAHSVALASLVLATFMKAWTSTASPTPDEPPPAPEKP